MFCTNCGQKVNSSNQSTVEKIKDSKPVYQKNEPTKSNSFSISKILILGFILIALIGIYYLSNAENENSNIQTMSMLDDIKGEWYDPHGIILGDKTTPIIFSSNDEDLVGSDKNGKISIKFTSDGTRETSVEKLYYTALKVILM